MQHQLYRPNEVELLSPLFDEDEELDIVIAILRGDYRSIPIGRTNAPAGNKR